MPSPPVIFQGGGGAASLRACLHQLCDVWSLRASIDQQKYDEMVCCFSVCYQLSCVYYMLQFVNYITNFNNDKINVNVLFIINKYIMYNYELAIFRQI